MQLQSSITTIVLHTVPQQHVSHSNKLPGTIRLLSAICVPLECIVVTVLIITKVIFVKNIATGGTLQVITSLD